MTTTTTLGFVPTSTIAAQVAHVARLRHLTAADMTLFDHDDWTDLVAAAFGVDNSDVRIGVIEKLLDAESPALLRSAA